MTLIQPNWFERRTPRQIVAILVAILVLIGLILWAYSGDSQSEKERKNAVNIGISQGQNGIITDLVENQNGVVQNAANNTNQAVNDFHNSVNRDSGTFIGNSTDVYCGRFPCDTSCGEWRAIRRPELVCPPR